MTDKPKSYEHGEPTRKIEEMRAAVAAKTMTVDEAIDALFAWAQEVGWEITRQGVEGNIRGGSKPWRDARESGVWNETGSQ